MLSFRTCQVLLLGTFLMAVPAFATRTHRAATSGHYLHHRRHHHVVRGQREIEPERAREIQEALIREHYLTAPASGKWDAATEAAMQKYQADHGWQTKLTPDSRALIKLGLGPRTDAISAESIPVNPSPASPAASVSPAASASAAASSTAASAAATPAGVNTVADAHSTQN